MQALKVITETLLNANKELTNAPYWIIIDPEEVREPIAKQIARSITGLFFSREDAELYLQSNKNRYSSDAFVYCKSGSASVKYCNLWNSVEASKNDPSHKSNPSDLLSDSRS